MDASGGAGASVGNGKPKKSGIDLTSRLYASSLHVGRLTDKGPMVPWAAAAQAGTAAPGGGMAASASALSLSTVAGLRDSSLPALVRGAERDRGFGLPLLKSPLP
jgi:hypothetical protein